MSKAETKRGAYKCGKCGGTGHNARRCGSAGSTTPVVKTVQPTETTSFTDDVGGDEGVAEEAGEQPESPPQVALSETQDLTMNRRSNTRPVAPSSPFECPGCNRVGILVLALLADQRKVLRCEHCYTKVQATAILKWGARPEDQPAESNRGSATRSFF